MCPRNAEFWLSKIFCYKFIKEICEISFYNRGDRFRCRGNVASKFILYFAGKFQPFKTSYNSLCERLN